MPRYRPSTYPSKKLLEEDGGPFLTASEMCFAAIVLRLDQIARNLDIDLGEAVREKFNLVSDRVGVDIKL